MDTDSHTELRQKLRGRRADCVADSILLGRRTALIDRWYIARQTAKLLGRSRFFDRRLARWTDGTIAGQTSGLL
jgi:hypothetical protein